MADAADSDRVDADPVNAGPVNSHAVPSAGRPAAPDEAGRASAGDDEPAGEPGAARPDADDHSGDHDAAPRSALALFGGALPAAERYAHLLASTGVERGLIGPAEAGRIWERHLLNCAVIARLLPEQGAVIDLGSGAGLPGIVVAILRPGVRMTLLEPMARRVEFLQECVAELGLENVDIVRGRAEDLAGHLAADVVTARAVAPLDKLAGLCLGLARPGGRVLAMKGSAAEAELAKARPVLARLGVSDARVVRVTGPEGDATATVVAFTAPARRSGQGAQRRGGRAAGRPGGAASRRDGPAGPPRGRSSRPNSRRGGG